MIPWETVPKNQWKRTTFDNLQTCNDSFLTDTYLTRRSTKDQTKWPHKILTRRLISNMAMSNKVLSQELWRSLWVKACNDKRTRFSRSFVSGSIKFPSLSNFIGGWNAWMNNSGLLMKWRSRKTPTWRRWYCARLPPALPAALTIAAGLSAQTFGGLEAQSTAFFRGAAN